MKLADKIILLRKQKGWSQEELAAQMDVSRQSVSKWESGASVPDIDKILLLSQIFGTTTDFLLKDDVEVFGELDNKAEDNAVKETPKRHVTRQEAMEFIEIRRKAAVRIPLAIVLCIISLAILIYLSQHPMGLPDNAAVSIGIVILLFSVAIAVAIFIINGMAIGKYEFIEKEEFYITKELEDEIRKESELFRPHFSRHIAIGVVLCILAVIPVCALSIFSTESFAVMCAVSSLSILFVIVACGVFIIVRAGILKGSYDQLLQEGDYTVQHKEANRKVGSIAPLYWIAITIIYVLLSFFTDRWDITWLVWVVAGMLFGMITIIVNIINEKNS